MNLIVNKRLDQAERKAIQELTLKKRQSKKSTMTQRQLIARQQLARELMRERLVPINLDEAKYYCLCRGDTDIDSNIDTDCDSKQPLKHSQSFPSSIASQSNISSNLELTSPNSATSGSLPSSSSEAINEASSCYSYSLTRTDSSFSGTSLEGHQQHQQLFQGSQDIYTETPDSQLKKKVQINNKRKQLEELNDELEQKLKQYENLVAREKALLKAHDIKLFTSESVNNFHLYEQAFSTSFDSPTRRKITGQRQQTDHADTQVSPASESSQAGTPNLRMTLC